MTYAQGLKFYLCLCEKWRIDSSGENNVVYQLKFFQSDKYVDILRTDNTWLETHALHNKYIHPSHFFITLIWNILFICEEYKSIRRDTVRKLDVISLITSWVITAMQTTTDMTYIILYYYDVGDLASLLCKTKKTCWIKNWELHF